MNNKKVPTEVPTSEKVMKLVYVSSIKFLIYRFKFFGSKKTDFLA